MEGFQIGAVHPTSIVSKSAKLGKGVTIGAGTIVYDNVVIEDNVVIGPGCFIGEPLSSYYSGGAYQNPELRIGEGSIIRSHSCLYAGSTIGKKFECGNRITIREKTKIGEHTRIGTLCDIQGNLTIGHYVRLHSNVH